MALINCPNCGKEISDKAPVCPACGYVFNEEKIVCKECGAEIPAGAGFCPNCGCPVEKTEEVQPIAEPPKKKKKGVGVIIAIILIIALAACGYLWYSHDQEVKTYNQFAELYNTMFDGAVKAETATGLIHDVWSNCIFDTKDSVTDKYTRKNKGSGAFYDDFNDALGCLFDDKDFAADLQEISDKKYEAESIIKGLAKHPASFDEEYKSFKECYNLFVKFCDMALSPNGSLKSYTEDINEVDPELADKFKELDIYFD